MGSVSVGATSIRPGHVTIPLNHVFFSAVTNLVFLTEWVERSPADSALSHLFVVAAMIAPLGYANQFASCASLYLSVMTNSLDRYTKLATDLTEMHNICTLLREVSRHKVKETFVSVLLFQHYRN